jgi:hypothetical protein
MIQSGNAHDACSAGSPGIDHVRDGFGAARILEPVVLTVEQEHRRVHARPGGGPILLLRLLMTGERSTIVGVSAGTCTLLSSKLRPAAGGESRLCWCSLDESRLTIAKNARDTINVALSTVTALTLAFQLLLLRGDLTHICSQQTL